MADKPVSMFKNTVGTQCNFYLLNRPKMKDKSIDCSLTVKNGKGYRRSIGVQTPANVGATRHASMKTQTDPVLVGLVGLFGKINSENKPKVHVVRHTQTQTQVVPVHMSASIGVQTPVNMMVNICGTPATPGPATMKTDRQDQLADDDTSIASQTSMNTPMEPVRQIDIRSLLASKILSKCKCTCHTSSDSQKPEDKRSVDVQFPVSIQLKTIKHQATQTRAPAGGKQTKATQCTDDNTTTRVMTLITAARHILQSTGEFDGLKYRAESSTSGEYLVITKAETFGCFGHPTDVASVTLDHRGRLTFQGLYVTAVEHDLFEFGVFDVGKFCDVMRKLSKIRFCKGIAKDYITDSNMHCVKKIEYPVIRYQAKKCEVFYEQKEKCIRGSFQCIRCKYASSYLNRVTKRAKTLTSSARVSRLMSGSNYPISRLSPENQRKRLKSEKNIRLFLRKRIKELETKLSEKSDT